MLRRHPLLSIIMICALSLTPCAAEEIIPEDFDTVVETPVVEDYAPAFLDDQVDAMRNAQQSLGNLGYYSGSVDGLYGKKTEAALRAFQRQSGLAETGHLDEDTYALLTKYPSDSIDAKAIQQRLIDLGYLIGAADGKIGPKSTKALELFQRLNGLKTTGKADAGTLALMFSDDVLALPSPLSAGSKGEDVRMLQTNLIRYGFMTGTPDGEYGQATTTAVRAFQDHLIEQGLPVEKTGTASPLTLYCLNSEAYSSYLRDVSLGMTDGEVRRVEQRLNALGYMDAEADDTFDDYAGEALFLFQWKAGQTQSSVADRKTIDSLFSAAAPKADHCAAHDIALGDSGLVVRDVQTALVNGGYTIQTPDGKYGEGMQKCLEMVADSLSEEDSTAHLSKDTVTSIQNGLLEYRTFDIDSAQDAMRLQRRLHTLYYLDKSGIDGKIGENTLKALHEFQDTNGLTQSDGTDHETISLLFSENAVAKLFPYRVKVSLERQEVEVWALNDLKTYDLVRTFTCSTGLHNSTPSGIFLNGRPVNRWHYFKKFYCWAQYSFVIEDDIMFHSVIFANKSESSLRRSSQRNLGNPASHGCVRLTVEDAQWLFENCKRGSLVIIIE